MRGLSTKPFRQQLQVLSRLFDRLFLTTSLAGCGWFGLGKKDDRPPDVLAQEAYQKMKSGRDEDAAENFERFATYTHTVRRPVRQS